MQNGPSGYDWTSLGLILAITIVCLFLSVGTANNKAECKQQNIRLIALEQRNCKPQTDFQTELRKLNNRISNLEHFVDTGDLDEASGNSDGATTHTTSTNTVIEIEPEKIEQ
jgi:uncharacterized protein YlxW (UPF0749 family)